MASSAAASVPAVRELSYPESEAEIGPQVTATLLHRLVHWERVRADAIYLTQPIGPGAVTDYSWSQVADQVRRMAAHLRSLHLPPRSHIAILGKNSAHWIMADLAIWVAGHVSVPLYPTLNAKTAAYVLDHSEATLLFVGKMDELWRGVASGLPGRLPRIALPLAPPSLVAPRWDDLVATAAPLRDIPEPAPDDLATIIYTSGSTGDPKGVMISFGAMIATARGLAEMFPVTTADRLLSYLPLAHTAERALVESVSLYHGCHVHFSESLATFPADLRRARPTLFFSVPRLWTKFHAQVCARLPSRRQALLFRLPIVSALVKRAILAKLGLGHVRAAITGSAPMSRELIAWYRDLGLELLEGYALTENFGYSHGSLPGRTRLGSVGHANPGVACRIADDGEVLVKSPTTMLGYFKDTAKTAETLTADGFLRTGDLGEVDDEGRLRITGRVKDLFKTSKGKYVAPVPIENRLGHHPCIEAVCVSGLGQPRAFALALVGPEAWAGFINGARRAAVTSELAALLDRVNESLEDHERLDYLVVVKDAWTMANGLLTPTMKIRRSVIEARYLPQADRWRASGTRVIWEGEPAAQGQRTSLTRRGSITVDGFTPNASMKA